MTLEFPTPGNKISFNGDLSQVTLYDTITGEPYSYPIVTYRLAIKSRYTNKDFDNSVQFPVYKWWVKLNRTSYNDRYTEFTVQNIISMSIEEMEGLYDYTLEGVDTVISSNQEWPEDSVVIQTGLIKVKNQNDTGRVDRQPTYQGPNDSGESYVIYNS